MMDDFPDRDWEGEVRFRKVLNARCLTPYSEMRKWRRRFWVALVLDVVLSILLLIYAASR